MQPARDIGLSKRKIPPVLEDALADPDARPKDETLLEVAATLRVVREVTTELVGIALSTT